MEASAFKMPRPDVEHVVSSTKTVKLPFSEREEIDVATGGRLHFHATNSLFLDDPCNEVNILITLTNAIQQKF